MKLFVGLVAAASLAGWPSIPAAGQLSPDRPPGQPPTDGGYVDYAGPGGYAGYAGPGGYAGYAGPGGYAGPESYAGGIGDGGCRPPCAPLSGSTPRIRVAPSAVTPALIGGAPGPDGSSPQPLMTASDLAGLAVMFAVAAVSIGYLLRRRGRNRAQP